MPGKKLTMVMASRNRGKIKELETLLREISPDIEVLGLDDIGYEGDIEENGETFEENAFIKASVPAKLGYIGIADDSGLCVDALGGAPGIYSARYSGKGSEANNDKLLLFMDPVPDGKRQARFVSVICVVFPDGTPDIMVRGECEGTITRERRGEGGFGYDPLFFYPPLGATFGELSAETKNRISHRANAMKKLAEEIKKII